MYCPLSASRRIPLRLLAAMVALAAAVPALARPGDPPSAVPAPTPGAPGQPGSESVSAPVKDSAEAAIQAALEAALAGNFAAYLAQIVPAERDGEEQRKQKERYEWKRFKAQAAWYLTARKPVTFQVVKREMLEDANQIKIFVKDQVHSERSPVPVQCVNEGGRWWIRTNSL
ncbi:MAG: hypothetical protein EXR79_11935 [Myxococcales bacterium]|nr:hypothetical protein [Myxococcales bacterium]